MPAVSLPIIFLTQNLILWLSLLILRDETIWSSHDTYHYIFSHGECCNHIGGLLYAIADRPQKENELASTSKPCIWSNHSTLNKPRKRKLTPRMSEDLVFKKQRMGTHPMRQLSVEKDHVLNKLNGCTVNIDRFKARLENDKLNVGWLKNFPQGKATCVDNGGLPILNNISFMYRDNIDLNSADCQKTFLCHLSKMSMSEEDVVKTEIVTRVQGSLEWKAARQERLTSSNFGTICKRKATTPPECLLKEMLYSNFSSVYTEYGKRHEKAARRTYLRQMKVEHAGLTVKESGLIVSTEHVFLGCSPDGLVHCSHCKDSMGLLEIKCPAAMKWRMSTPEECCADKSFFCSLNNGVVTLRHDHKYYYQVQGQMGVSGRRWCDFVVWTCMGISVERIEFNPVMWE